MLRKKVVGVCKALMRAPGARYSVDGSVAGCIRFFFSMTSTLLMNALQRGIKKKLGNSVHIALITQKSSSPSVHAITVPIRRLHSYYYSYIYPRSGIGKESSNHLYNKRDRLVHEIIPH